ncbi:class I SAM-dependent methyltransferase (plasmid) [Streptomyces sp. BI20]|uniref:class I SAM-dependent methyltransferase n=1 Tax=Streptomyces sp. BI20 TaxID=3403460 RepID=UPI003C73EDD8
MPVNEGKYMSIAYGDGALNKEIPTELARLHRLEELFDPISRQAIEHVLPPPDACCWDVGAGAGSIARHLTRRLPRARITATDIDTRFLRDLEPRVRVLEHDVTQDMPPTGPFDLIHIRMVLEHLPDRDRVVRRLIEWLKPGGSLVVVGVDLSQTGTSPHHALHTSTRAIAHFLATQLGTDATFTRALPPMLARAGMTDIGASFHPLTAGDAGAGSAFYLALLEQLSGPLLAGGALDAEQIEAARRWFGEPGNVDIVGVAPAVWGRRPH